MAAKTGTPLLSVRGLCASAGSLEILNGVDLEVFPERSMPSWAPTGSGKSTLANVLAGRPTTSDRRRSPL